MKLMKRSGWIMSLFVAALLLSTPLFSLAEGAREVPSGFTGVSWNRVVPVNKATLVQHDENSYLDDLAYMAAIPSSVFYDHNTDKLYSNPLLFYEDNQELDRKNRTLNAYKGLNYFMEDWQTYTGGVKKIETINMGDREPWQAKNYTHINGQDPYSIATQMALEDWSYADSAVVAALGNMSGTGNTTTGTMTGTMSAGSVKHIRQTAVKQDSIAPQYNDFYVADDYKYIKANLTWPSKSWLPTLSYLGTLGLLQGGLTIPSADPDLHLYCNYGGLMQVASSQNWNVMAGASESCESYIYAPGNWKSAVVDIPTKGPLGERHGTIMERIRDLITGQVHYLIDISLYPGKEIEIPEATPFMCRDVTFELSWKGGGPLGLVIVDENNVAVGEAVATNVSKQTLELDQLGEGNYRAVVVQLGEAEREISYTINYEWKQSMRKDSANSLMNAAEGAILASLTNSPLLYTPADDFHGDLERVLTKLGVDHVYYVDIGNQSDDTIRQELRRICSIKKEYHTLEDIYHDIRGRSEENDIVFTTIDPWTTWRAEELAPAEEKEKALYLGSAAYLAAHHGAPLMAVDMHPPLSRAVVWHTEWWKDHAVRDDEPNVGAMYLTSKEAYDYLDEIGFDKPGERESIITVAGQFDIGVSWDRAFVGAATPGRLIGTPVDTAQWASRSAFYPALIYANPAVSQNTVSLINGSRSTRQLTGLLNIEKPSQEESFHAPVLASYMTYAHRFNERAGEYWDFQYTTNTGITPFYQPSTNPIDQGVLDKYGKYGSYYPDLSETEVVPFYLEKCGYEMAYATNFTATMEDLNRGVVAWFETTHGFMENSGSLAFWNPHGVPGFFGLNLSLPTVEPNPWRGYELYLPGWLDGSTQEPDVLSQSQRLGLDIVPAKLSDLPLSDLLPVIKRTGYDGIIITVLFGRLRTKDYTGYEMEEAMENLHSMGFNALSCLISNTYLHLSLIRHGCVWQVIDPWETSWYSAFASEMFARDLALGKNVGQAYTDSILHTGIGYLTKDWWWDIKENLCYFGDPDLSMWSPQYGWDKPESLDSGTIHGHAPFGATDYPQEEEEGGFSMIIGVGLILIVAAAGAYLGWKYKQRKS